MLLSELEERERRFKLALRAGIPLLLLISLVFYSTLFREKHVSLGIEIIVLFGSLLFITVYFIYFLMELSVKESLLDQTTQGFNERAFVEKLKSYQPKTLVMLIIKNLSTINENYSTEEVNDLLYTFTHKLNDTLQTEGLSKALIARRYGAEFLIAIDQNGRDIEKIFKTFIEKNHLIDQIEVDYAFAAITNTADDLEKDLLHLKDLIAIQSKNSDTTRLESTIKDSRELSEIEESILFALKKKDLVLSFRPLLNTKTEEIDIYEISVKLRSADRGEILPRTYLPIINRLGLGREYDMALFQHVLKLLPLVDDAISLSFNLSPFSLRDKTFQREYFHQLDQSKVDPKRLIIELYERKTHHNLSGYLKTLDQFRAKGVRIAIDNFGSSNASMEYMKHFHFDIVQFDRDYVTKLEDKNTYAMLNSLIQMANELNIITVAKWVDKPEQKKKLIQMGIDYLQGFGIAKAVTEYELIKTYN
ncbi:EAL domain-containing protein [Sulfurovum sp. ST-21]|uniref:EAL domain-containing protein n=1 Tax=Sulfurovum indicum TaxID=2779528 RepID=A0A7M1S2W7_9BACT|nr:EAL domain-containing protein [Sulfurovum indicum]QOR61767.1 EAL domain-containing protein [Sulfurovum indicum]